MILKYFTLQIYKKFLYKTDLQRKKFKYFVKMRKKPKKIIFIPFPQPCHFRQRLNYCQKMLLYEFI